MISMNLEPEFFQLVAEGKKRVEFRRYDEKRKQIKAGDIIQFIDSGDGKTIKVKVLTVIPCKKTAFGVASYHHEDDAGMSRADLASTLNCIYPGCRNFCAIWFTLLKG